MFQGRLALDVARHTFEKIADRITCPPKQQTLCCLYLDVAQHTKSADRIKCPPKQQATFIKDFAVLQL